ncbi:fatty acid desaturase [Coralliovum pocilloporae]|uniref:fatty acid desaturase n=1 Tax=Coralliovum pocilloporae TaxID=3066369 RepID=UPI00330701B7
MSDVDHRALIASLSKDERDHLLTLEDRPGLIRLGVHMGLILGLGWAVAAGVSWWPLLLVPQGVLIVFLFTLLHETIHNTAFRTRWLNSLVARICGVMILLPSDWFRYFHFAHHRHTHDPDKDPELQSPKPERLWDYMVHLSGGPVWLSLVKTLVLHGAKEPGDAFVPERGRQKVRREALAHLAFYGVLAGTSVVMGNAVLFWVWLLPMLLGQPFLRAYLLAEHTRCPHVANMLANSRTTFTNAVIRFVAWNMPYHAEHHAYPAVPFHKLPEFHRLTAPHLQETEQGYTRFHRTMVRDFQA